MEQLCFHINIQSPVPGQHVWSVQVGHGTVEIVTEPGHDLHEIAEVYDSAMDHLIDTAKGFDAAVLGYVQVTLESGSPVSPRVYEVLRNMLDWV